MTKYRIEIDHDRRLNRITIREDLSLESIKGMLTALWSSPGFDPSYGTLQEETRTSLEALDVAAIDALHEFVERNDPRLGPVAIVVGEGRLKAGIGKYIEVKREFRGLTRRRELRHFGRVDEALEWLESHRPAAP